MNSNSSSIDLSSRPRALYHNHGIPLLVCAWISASTRASTHSMSWSRDGTLPFLSFLSSGAFLASLVGFQQVQQGPHLFNLASTTISWTRSGTLPFLSFLPVLLLSPVGYPDMALSSLKGRRRCPPLSHTVSKLPVLLLCSPHLAVSSSVVAAACVVQEPTLLRRSNCTYEAIDLLKSACSVGNRKRDP